jgi:mono/diheme cytochrome c family protein
VPALPPAAPPAPAPSGASAAQREADLVFAQRCSVCHGPRGEGDGPGSIGLEPKPRNFHDPAWQASVTDEHLRRVIVEGGGAVGKSPLMLPNPDLAAKPEIVAALVVQIRSLGGR